LAACPLCQSSGASLHENLVDRLFGAPGTWNLRECENRRCGLVWLDPQPISSEIWKLYRNYWTHGTVEPSTARAYPDRAPSLRKRAKALAGILLPWRRTALRSEARYLEDRPSGKLLDVGCGSGEFLAEMANRGWHAVGLEFDEDAIRAARRHPNIEVLAGGLSDQEFEGSQFDAVTLSNVIEHLPDPVEVFAELNRVLKPGGRLVIITPNAQSLGHRQFGRCWRGLEPPRHLFIFTHSSLTAIAQRVGFDRVSCFTTVGSSSGILEASKDLWDRSSSRERPPNLRTLLWRERLLTAFNAKNGEFLVLVGSK
jgi:SAM-dependent methyltransferase